MCLTVSRCLTVFDWFGMVFVVFDKFVWFLIVLVMFGRRVRARSDRSGPDPRTGHTIGKCVVMGTCGAGVSWKRGDGLSPELSYVGQERK